MQGADELGLQRQKPTNQDTVGPRTTRKASGHKSFSFTKILIFAGVKK